MNGFMKWAANAKGIEKSAIITEVQAYSAAIAGGQIYPPSFQYTHSNPNTATLKEMFRRFGIENSLAKISGVYMDELGRNFAPALIESTLDAFVKRRHEAAHHGRINGVARGDIVDYKIFLIALSAAINSVIVTHISAIN